MLHAVKGGLLSYCDKVYSRGNINQKHRIGGVMVSVLASSVVDHGFEPRSGQTKNYKIGICCFSGKHAAFRRKSKDWLTRNQNNVSEWSDISTRVLFLFCLSSSCILCALCCQFLWIVHLTRLIVKLLVLYTILHHGYHSIFVHLKMCYIIGKFSNVLFVFVMCALCVASFSGLFICDCPYGIL